MSQYAEGFTILWDLIWQPVPPLVLFFGLGFSYFVGLWFGMNIATKRERRYYRQLSKFTDEVLESWGTWVHILNALTTEEKEYERPTGILVFEESSENKNSD